MGKKKTDAEPREPPPGTLRADSDRELPCAAVGPALSHSASAFTAVEQRMVSLAQRACACASSCCLQLMYFPAMRPGRHAVSSGRGSRALGCLFWGSLGCTVARSCAYVCALHALPPGGRPAQPPFPTFSPFPSHLPSRVFCTCRVRCGASSGAIACPLLVDPLLNGLGEKGC